MDSVTHIILGAAIGESILGKKIGRKAALVGALAKSIPDFDLFYTGLKDPFAYMCYHRGHTHSLILETLYAFPLAAIFYFLFGKKVEFKYWIVLFLICLWGHSILDTFTNYGTRLLLPFSNTAFSANNLSIVDLAFSLPMIILFIIGMCFKNGSLNRIRFNKSVLIYCFIYLGFTVVNKYTSNQILASSLKENNIKSTKSFSNPTILNNLLWYGMAVNDSNLYVAEWTLLKPKNKIKWYKYPRNIYLLDNYDDKTYREALQWFSNGYSIAENDGDTLNVYCTKFGRTNMTQSELEKSFIFHYKLFKQNGETKMNMEEPNEKNANMKEGIKDLWQRIIGINKS